MNESNLIISQYLQENKLESTNSIALDVKSQLYADKETGYDKKESFIVDLARDRSHTELLIQKYIIQNSNILLIIVSNLTYSDQKLINRLKLNAKDKKLFIIHNLKDFTEIRQVKEYIKNNLFQWLNIIEIIMPSETNDDLNNIFYQELKDSKDISHFIYAREGSEAGSYYNISTEKFLLKTIRTHTTRVNLIQ